MTEWGAFMATDIGVPIADVGKVAPSFGDVVRGRYFMPDPGTGKGGYRTRVTTFAERLEDTWALSAWEKRVTLYGLTLREDLYVKACGTELADTKGMDEIVRDAKEAGGGSVGANIGTGLHGLFNAHDAGGVDRTPEKYRRKVKLYAEALRSNRLTVHPGYAERLIINERYNLCGRTDGAVTEAGRADHTTIDYKSQAAWHSWGKVAIQLAIYAHADYVWNPDTATYEPPPPMREDVALVFWVPVRGKNPDDPVPDFIEVIEVDIARAWGHACPLADQVREWQNEGKRKGALSRPYRAPVERYGARMRDAGSIPELHAIAAEAGAHGIWSEELRMTAELMYEKLAAPVEIENFIRGKGYV